MGAGDNSISLRSFSGDAWLKLGKGRNSVGLGEISGNVTVDVGDLTKIFGTYNGKYIEGEALKKMFKPR